jgi:hypothetical protein
MWLCCRNEPSLYAKAVGNFENLGEIIQFTLNLHVVVLPSQKEDLDVLVATAAPIGKDTSSSLAEISREIKLQDGSVHIFEPFRKCTQFVDVIFCTCDIMGRS